MRFVARFQCENGHQQEIKYGDGFSREYVEDHCSLMFGGRLHSIGKEMPSHGCGWVEDNGPTCGENVHWWVVEDVKAS